MEKTIERKAALPQEIAMIALDMDGTLLNSHHVTTAYTRAALERAAKAGVESAVVSRKDFASAEEFNDAMLNTLKEHGIGAVVLAGHPSMVGENVIAAYRDKILNVHPSLIPSFCGPGFYGLRVHEAALAKGVKVTGATVHLVNEKYDDGRIVLQKAVDVLPGDTPEVLQRRVMEQAEWILLPRALDMLTSGEV